MWNISSRFLPVFSLLALLVCFAGCERLFFYPSNVKYETPDQFGVKFEEFHVETKDEPTLIGWLLHADGAPKGTIIQLHGNAENMSSHVEAVKWLPAFGYNVVTVDYRGFGGSNGTPSFGGAITDVERTFRFVRSMPGVDPNRLVLLAQSIGGSLGIYAASEPEFAGMFRAMIVDSAFSSYHSVAREKMNEHVVTAVLAAPFILGVSAFYDPINVVQNIKAGRFLFIAHEIDPIVPLHNTKDLFAKAAEPKELWTLPGTGHIATFRTSEDRLRLNDYLKVALGN